MDNLKYSIENQIVCNKCVEELSNESNPEINLKNYSKFEVGFTSSGFTECFSSTRLIAFVRDNFF